MRTATPDSGVVEHLHPRRAFFYSLLQLGRCVRPGPGEGSALRMGHQCGVASVWGAEAGDGVQTAVWVVGVEVGGVSCVIRIPHRH